MGTFLVEINFSTPCVPLPQVVIVPTNAAPRGSAVPRVSRQTKETIAVAIFVVALLVPGVLSEMEVVPNA